MNHVAQFRYVYTLNSPPCVNTILLKRLGH